MTIEERLEALTRRHEALMINLELTRRPQAQDTENIRALLRIAQTRESEK